ncbi:MAG: hypothetical protein OHK0023_24430 [Anaerolineae bacterium]
MRRVVRLASLVFVTSLILGTLSTRAAGSAPLRVSSGDVTQTSAVLWAVTSVKGELEIVVVTDPSFAQDASGTIQGQVAVVSGRVEEPTVPFKAKLADFSPNTRYYYRATDASGATADGTFITAAVVGEKTGLRFGASGDWRGDTAPYPAIQNADERELDFFILLGDTIYADYPSPDVPAEQAKTIEEYRAKHNEVIAPLGGMNTWADVRAKTAVLATIDDHEVTNDFSGGAAPSTDTRFDQNGQFINETNLYKTGMQAFFEYMPIEATTYGQTGDPLTAGKPKLYRYMTYGSDAAVMILDARSFRDAPLPALTDFSPAKVAEYLAATYTPGRTMLGKVQLEDLKADLLRAQAAGITWKFVVVPEPIQNMGPLAASDRFEGYAAERVEILKHINENNIRNVVFISADIHGTLVNNIYYSETLGGERIETTAWEITTGSVAFDAPFGPTVVDLAAQLNLITPQQRAIFNLLPQSGKDSFMRQLMDAQFEGFGLDLVGLAGSNVPAQLLSGDYLQVNTFGWTEFEIDAATQQLTVTTYGIPPYTAADAQQLVEVIVKRQPEIIQQFTVDAR